MSNSTLPMSNSTQYATAPSDQPESPHPESAHAESAHAENDSARGEFRDALVYTTIDSPIGELLLLGDGETLRGLYMQDGRKPVAISSAWKREQAPFAAVTVQLEEYFSGHRQAFDIRLELHGTPFERRVWSALQEIPYGETTSYGELASRIGQPTGARAVGLANGRNPIGVIVPCHRVIGADGSLTGYGGGLERKRILLELEQGQARLGM
jgi:methylated-DNA-[protein]-cysteine S-methyltransferase